MFLEVGCVSFPDGTAFLVGLKGGNRPFFCWGGPKERHPNGLFPLGCPLTFNQNRAQFENPPEEALLSRVNRGILRGYAQAGSGRHFRLWAQRAEWHILSGDMMHGFDLRAETSMNTRAPHKIAPDSIWPQEAGMLPEETAFVRSAHFRMAGT